MIIDALNKRPSAWRRTNKISHQSEIDIVMRFGILGGVHELNREIDAFRWRIGALRRENVLLTQDRHMTFNGESGALIVVRDNALAQDDAFAGL